MSMYIGYINDATAQIERSCREIRECASKLVEAAPSASTNTGMVQCQRWRPVGQCRICDIGFKINCGADPCMLAQHHT
jgi:hypothetical protein